MEERLQKILARAGYGSRRACEELLRQQRVAVNGQIAQLGQRADPEHDRITVDGEPIVSARSHTYIALHKPRGILSDEGDSSGRLRTVFDLVPSPERLFAVGRLDVDSEGLILLTDDGELAHRLTHPRYKHEKEYHVCVQGHPDEQTLDQWRRGVFLDGRQTAPAKVTVVEPDADLPHERETTWLRVVMHEGRKRQIRRIAAMLGHPARRVIRVRIGPLRLGDLAPGRWRKLTGAEVKALQSATQEYAKSHRGRVKQ